MFTDITCSLPSYGLNVKSNEKEKTEKNHLRGQKTLHISKKKLCVSRTETLAELAKGTLL